MSNFTKIISSLFISPQIEGEVPKKIPSSPRPSGWTPELISKAYMTYFRRNKDLSNTAITIIIKKSASSLCRSYRAHCRDAEPEFRILSEHHFKGALVCHDTGSCLRWIEAPIHVELDIEDQTIIGNTVGFLYAADSESCMSHFMEDYGDINEIIPLIKVSISTNCWAPSTLLNAIDTAALHKTKLLMHLYCDCSMLNGASEKDFSAILKEKKAEFDVRGFEVVLHRRLD